MKKQTKSVSAKGLRKLLGNIADDICSAQERMNIALSGNTFEIHLECASISITINEQKGGER